VTGYGDFLPIFEFFIYILYKNVYFLINILYNIYRNLVESPPGYTLEVALEQARKGVKFLNRFDKLIPHKDRSGAVVR